MVYGGLIMEFTNGWFQENWEKCYLGIEVEGMRKDDCDQDCDHKNLTPQPLSFQ